MPRFELTNLLRYEHPVRSDDLHGFQGYNIWINNTQNPHENWLTTCAEKYGDYEYVSVYTRTFNNTIDPNIFQVVYVSGGVAYCCFIGLFLHALIRFRARRKRNRRLLLERMNTIHIMPNVLAEIVAQYT